MTFIIAEIGINHNGSVETAKRLIEAAKWAGADAVKFQKRTVEIVYKGQLDQPRESPWGTTLGEQKRGLEFSEAAYDAIAIHCKSLNMPWFASCWDIPSLEFMRKYDCPYNKIASAMVTNTEFLKAVAGDRRVIIMSTGLSTLDNINKALDILQRIKVTLLHCIGVYPCPEYDLNLQMIPMLKRLYPNHRIGYSGHEASVSPSVIAVALGAEVVERHLTIDRSMYGSDQAASLEPHGFKSMVDQIRKIPNILGDGVKRVTAGEMAVAKKLRYWE